MTQLSIKEAIQGIADLKEDTNIPMINIMRPWMIITDLSFKDAIHLTHRDMIAGLVRVHNKLGEVLDVLDEDQLRESACRCLKEVVVYGDEITDGEIAVRHSQRLSWDGSNWNYTADPKLRQRATSKSYIEALATVRELFGD